MDVGISDDYAVLLGKGFGFYYGYEKTNDNDEWLFTGNFNGVTYEKTAKELNCNQFDPPEQVLLHGIGAFLGAMASKEKCGKCKSYHKDLFSEGFGYCDTTKADVVGDHFINGCQYYNPESQEA